MWFPRLPAFSSLAGVVIFARLYEPDPGPGPGMLARQTLLAQRRVVRRSERHLH